MSINVATEQVLTLRQACDLIPRRRGGKKTAVETLYRWSLTGCRRIKLETVQIGATRCTSREALQRFFDALTAAATTSGSSISPTKPSLQRQAEIAAAEKDCRQKGI